MSCKPSIFKGNFSLIFNLFLRNWSSNLSFQLADDANWYSQENAIYNDNISWKSVVRNAANITIKAGLYVHITHEITSPTLYYYDTLNLHLQIILNSMYNILNGISGRAMKGRVCVRPEWKCDVIRFALVPPPSIEIEMWNCSEIVCILCT